jgi:hypothetical protein
VTRPANYVGMRSRSRADGSPFLAGIAHEEFTVPLGARFHLRRVRAHDDDCGPAFVLVIAPPDPLGTSKTEQARACIDNAPAVRRDPRDKAEGEGSDAPC